jgi:hypothetical protein
MILLARARAQRVAGVTAELCAQLASLSAAMPTENPRRLLAQVHTPVVAPPSSLGPGVGSSAVSPGLHMPLTASYVWIFSPRSTLIDWSTLTIISVCVTLRSSAMWRSRQRRPTPRSTSASRSAAPTTGASPQRLTFQPVHLELHSFVLIYAQWIVCLACPLPSRLSPTMGDAHSPSPSPSPSHPPTTSAVWSSQHRQGRAAVAEDGAAGVHGEPARRHAQPLGLVRPVRRRRAAGAGSGGCVCKKLC